MGELTLISKDKTRCKDNCHIHTIALMLHSESAFLGPILDGEKYVKKMTVSVTARFPNTWFLELEWLKPNPCMAAKNQEKQVFLNSVVKINPF